ncbi:MAG: hypothetical protein M0P49_01055 [Bacilli bacterium]|nr:hypothetical protein [Bacilli bacterium]
MCEKCKDGGNILDGYFENSKGKSFTRLRFDLDNNQFDMQYGMCGEDDVPTEYEWTHSIDISFCPFCGKRLSISITVAEFIDFIKSTGLVNEESFFDNNLLQIIENKADLSLNINNNIIGYLLTNKYGTEVESLNKKNGVINIFFREPTISI